MNTTRFDKITSYLSSRNWTVDDAIADIQAKLTEATEFAARKDISIADKMSNNWTIGLLRSYLKEYEAYKAIKEHKPEAPTLWLG